MDYAQSISRSVEAPSRSYLGAARILGLPWSFDQLMKRSTPAARVYAALFKRANWKTGLVDSTYDQISEQAGMARSGVAPGVKKLIEWGYMELVAKGSQHRPNTYRLLPDPVDNSLSGPEIRPAESRVNHPSGPDFRPTEHVQQTGFPTPAGRISGLTTESSPEQKQAEQAAAGAVASPAAEASAACLPAEASPTSQGADFLRTFPSYVSEQVVEQCHEHVTGLLGTWKPKDLTNHLLQALSGRTPRDPMAVLTVAIRKTRARLTAASAAATQSIPEWCGRCSGEALAERQVDVGGNRWAKCPNCHPVAIAAFAKLSSETA